MSSITGSAMDKSVTQVMMDKALRIIIHALDNIEACMRAGKDEKMAPSIPRLGGSMQSLKVILFCMTIKLKTTVVLLQTSLCTAKDIMVVIG